MADDKAQPTLEQSTRILEALRDAAELEQVRVIEFDKTARQFKSLDITTITVKLRVPTASLSGSKWTGIDAKG